MLSVIGAMSQPATAAQIRSAHSMAPSCDREREAEARRARNLALLAEGKEEL